jgi:hypothetical protein
MVKPNRLLHMVELDARVHRFAWLARDSKIPMV